MMVVAYDPIGRCIAISEPVDGFVARNRKRTSYRVIIGCGIAYRFPDHLMIRRPQCWLVDSWNADSWELCILHVYVEYTRIETAIEPGRGRCDRRLSNVEE